MAYAADRTLPKDGHVFLTRTYLQSNPALSFCNPPSGRPIALAGQQQIAVFFVTDGAVNIDPDTMTPPLAAIPVFEVPIVPPLPEDLGFIP